MYNHDKHSAVREDILDSLDCYAQKGVPTGGFLEAVLSNNLMESFARADVENKATMFEICMYIYWELPSGCHGSLKRVSDWLLMKSKERELAKEANG